MPHGMLVGRPNSSPLMKFAMRPKKRPMGTAAVHRSAALQPLTLLRRANAQMAMAQPTSAPWKAMPPFHTAMMSCGLAR